MSTIGQGRLVSGGRVEGTLRRADDVQQVFGLMKRDDLSEVILLTATASATAVVPLLAKVRGVVCRSGGLTSHLAIVSREFGLPCIVGAEIEDPEGADGQRVVLGDDGTITLAG
jgi:phosphohistidine swiveling domain-containing protein